MLVSEYPNLSDTIYSISKLDLNSHLLKKFPHSYTMMNGRFERNFAGLVGWVIDNPPSWFR